MSPYYNKIGGVTFTGENEKYAYIVGDSAKEQHVIDFILAQRIDSVALYDLHRIFPDDDVKQALKSFMKRLRDNGVTRILGIGAEYKPHWDNMLDFHNNIAPFDGFLTEIEFWNGGATFEEFIELLEYARELPWKPAPNGEKPTLASYVGWITQEQVDEMVPLLDYLYVHAYVTQASLAYPRVEERFQFIADANQRLGTNTKVLPIYSAEDHDWAAGNEYFMGEWLQTNCIPKAEAQFMKDFEAGPYANKLELAGHMFYEYFFASKYLEANCGNPCTSSQYLYPDGTCHNACSSPFTATIQKSCTSLCNIDEYTLADKSCSSTCSAPDVVKIDQGGLKYCETPTTGLSSIAIAGIVVGATVVVVIIVVIIKKKLAVKSVAAVTGIANPVSNQDGKSLELSQVNQDATLIQLNANRSHV